MKQKSKEIRIIKLTFIWIEVILLAKGLTIFMFI